MLQVSSLQVSSLQVSSYHNTNKFFNETMNEKNKNIFEPCKKHLTIIACHLYNKQRIQVLKQNIRFLSFSNNDIIIINSSNLLLNNVVKNVVKNELQNKVKQYIEIPNDKWIDFGKWKYVLNNIDYSNYEYITFTNDSFSISQPIYFYFNLLVERNKELYAYTSSSEVKYHFQSYLFTVKKEAICKLKNYLTTKINPICKNINPILLELHLINAFQTYDCFLDIGNLHINNKKNIFFNNDLFYFILFKYNLLPFIKLKRINKPHYKRTSITFSPKLL